MIKYRFRAKPNLSYVHNFFDIILDMTADFQEEQRENIMLVFEEVFVNITNYAYKDKKKKKRVSVSFSKKNDVIRIKFVDSGTPFNPLEREDPDTENITKPGGFGIFFIKKLTDENSYRRRFGKNILIVEFKRK